MRTLLLSILLEISQKTLKIRRNLKKDGRTFKEICLSPLKLYEFQFQTLSEDFDRIVIDCCSLCYREATKDSRIQFYNRILQLSVNAKTYNVSLVLSKSTKIDPVLQQHPLNSILTVCKSDKELEQWLTAEAPSLSSQHQLLSCIPQLSAHVFAGFLAYVLSSLPRRLREAAETVFVDEDKNSTIIFNSFVLIAPKDPQGSTGCHPVIGKDGRPVTLKSDSPVYPKFVQVMRYCQQPGGRSFIFVGCVAAPAYLLAQGFAARDKDDETRGRLLELLGHELARCGGHPELGECLDRVQPQASDGANVVVVTDAANNEGDSLGDRLRETLASLQQSEKVDDELKETSDSCSRRCRILSTSDAARTNLTKKLVDSDVEVADSWKEADCLLMVKKLQELRQPRAETLAEIWRAQKLSRRRKKCCLALLIVVDRDADKDADPLSHLPPQLSFVPRGRIACVSDSTCNSVTPETLDRLIGAKSNSIDAEFDISGTPICSTDAAVAMAMNIVFGFVVKIKADPKSSSTPHCILLPKSGRFPDEASWQKVVKSKFNGSSTKISWSVGSRVYFRRIFDFDSQLRPGTRCRAGFEIPAGLKTQNSLGQAKDSCLELAEQLTACLKSADCEKICRIVLWDDNAFDTVSKDSVASMLKSVEVAANDSTKD